MMWLFFFFKQKTAYEMRISDWSSDVCSSDLIDHARGRIAAEQRALRAAQHLDAFEVEEFGLEQAGREQRVAIEVDRGRAVAGRADAQVADATDREARAGEIGLGEGDVGQRQLQVRRQIGRAHV